MKLGNPFDLVPALIFALLLASVSLVAAWVNSRFGAAGLYPFAAVTGLVDVDAVSVSTARLASKSIEIATAATAILVALASNGIARACYAGFIERGPLALRLAIVTLAALGAGSLGLVVSNVGSA
ncbi:hypothetical protein GCM10010994_09710 [Chelatococcus reniformis]|uniref:DUF4010 domain-containing protein n=2 Tax=Chelatococcus reniformis TaxID=1494448 RepID=A0A916X8R8_9HYPH|nr:hypothetical protein GCM10010994_09710 [Chelatococcus reniformis]